MTLWTLILLATLAAVAQCQVRSKIQGPSRMEADRGEFPYYGFVMDRRSQALITAGVLIKTKVLLTLGYNYYANDIKPEDIMVVLGTHNKSSTEESRQEIEATEILIHPELISTWQGAKTGDVALIKLKTAATINRRVKTLSVKNINKDPKNDNKLASNGQCITMGYGRIVDTDYETILPRILQKYEPDMATHKQCENYSALNGRTWDKKSWLCSLNADRTETRPGDGGNPLVCTLSITINPTLFGLVSGGTPGKDRDGYSFFTRLSSYRDWITTNA